MREHAPTAGDGDGGFRAVAAPREGIQHTRARRIRPRRIGPHRIGPKQSAAAWLTAFGAFLLLPLAGCTDPTPTMAPTECSVPGRSSLRDLDPRDTPETPWHKEHGQELVIHFETGDLSGRYAGLSSAAVGHWSASPCIQAVAVPICPEEANCVTMVEEDDAGDDGQSDGSFRGRDRGVYRSGGRITLHTGLLDRSNDNGALATIVHEMGHALGLVHRLDPQDVMNAYTSDATDPQPDGVNFVNLAVIYGTRH